MEVKILKKSIEGKVGGAFQQINYEYYINNTLKLNILKEEEKYFLVEVSEDIITEQNFRGTTWYQSKDRQFGVFRDDTMKYNNTKEKGWRILFQRR